MNAVRISTGFTSNLGNYESLRTHIEYERELRDGETFEEAADEIYSQVEAKLVEKGKEIYETMSRDARRATQINPE